MPGADDSIDTHGHRIMFGKHSGELWTRIPVGYLRWLCNLEDAPKQQPDAREYALAELGRRGQSIHDQVVEISGHAIDSASLRLWNCYKSTRTDCNEGLNAWLIRITTEALNSAPIGLQGRIRFGGIRFVFQGGQHHPILKTVMKDKKSGRLDAALCATIPSSGQ